MQATNSSTADSERDSNRKGSRKSIPTTQAEHVHSMLWWAANASASARATCRSFSQSALLPTRVRTRRGLPLLLRACSTHLETLSKLERFVRSKQTRQPSAFR